jgi:Glycosyl hydrolase catalytic core
VKCPDSPLPPKGSMPVLLGWNELDSTLCGAGPLGGKKASRLWPVIEATGATRLGSPSTTTLNAFTWLPQFLAGNSTYKPKVDFICIHWHALGALDFLNFVDDTWAIFKKPIWITEFTVADWTATSQKPSKLTEQYAIDFLKVVLPALELRSYVQRYAYYSDIANPALAFSSLWFKNKTLTAVGRAYAGY